MNTRNGRYQLQSLFVKPVAECTADCSHCRLRRQFRAGKDKLPALTLPDYHDLFADAAPLGVRSLHISGGEPTLFPGLVDLVRLGKQHGWFVILNTNGSRPDRRLATDLLWAGLDAVIISLQGAYPATHDAIRGRPGHWEKTVETINIYRNARQHTPSFFLTTQTIISRRNFRELPGIIDRVCSSDVDAHGLSYLEADFAKENLLDLSEIDELRQGILPQITSRLKRHSFAHPLLRVAATRAAKKIYRGDGETRRKFSLGYFRGFDRLSPCRAPEVFAMVTTEGFALPCSMVEYVHAPIMGNVRDAPLSRMWNSKQWNDFRQNRFKWCRHCPVYLHFHIPVSASLRKLIRLSFRNPAPEQKSILTRIREALL